MAQRLYAHESLGKNGVLDRVFEKLQTEQIVRIKIEALSLDSTSVKVHPDGTGALKKRPQAIGKSRGGWNTKIHMVAADARTPIIFSLSPGNAHDAPEGRSLLDDLGPMPEGLPMLMDKAYEGNETRQLVLDLCMIPVVPPKSNRLDPWQYDRELYKKRNEIERLFRRLKASVAYSPDLRNSTSFSSPLSISSSSSKPSDSVNTP